MAIPDRATAAVHQGMYQYSEVNCGKRIFCIWDPPASQLATDIITYFVTTAALYQASEMGAMAWPRVKVMNPNKTVYGNTDTLVVCCSGYWAGTMARGDNVPGGIYQPPAGIDHGRLFGVVGVETETVLDETVRDLVFPKNINPINFYGGYYVDGARCAKDNGNFPTIGERRGASYIEQTLKAGMLFAKHRNNNRRLRAECDRTSRAFLLQQLRLEAFASMNPEEAFVLDWDIPGTGLNNAAVQYQRLLKARVGLAFSKPAEFIWMEFSADLRAVEEALLVESA
jgi:phage tail sheath protein FI